MSQLSIDSLSKAYGPVQALRDMSFEVRAGEIFGFVGSNGAGKSTTMRIVLGVLAADSGEVRWDGRPLDLHVRRRIGYMPEERGLYPRMRVGEHLVYLARLHGMSRTAAVAAMEHWTDVLGIDARRGDEVLKLSLGNQQRVQLAAALVHSPDILVLDEPFSGLDPVAVDVMSQVLRDQAAAGVPVMFSSHQLELVERLCDRVGIVRAGSMVAVGGIDELRSTPERRWEVDGPAPDDWLARVPAARLVSSEPASGSSAGTGAARRSVVEVANPDLADVDQELLAAALAAGPVREFARVRPSLVELYRHVVSSDESPAASDRTPAEVTA
ncbi:MAG: ATP-binding cassette domain-containing protein [Cellulomonas sp.]|uniref:ABC transporter ATP-binding protein n=1 Tax=Cellulomonas gelida TaxID=1712 RepID=A0A4Y3KJ20_9CELL|nr:MULTISPECIES: ATP-binding cassette domain-containing protein [Cellulomonas]KMM44532.1 ABC transporter ATP-binding protein [Cellulomonas sp. A375-1]MCR6648077.1 ATP-binding cassette domain-containing protein [Cellulomonas sp.]GEA84017.1 ABC transporter ATP-binding protein [Cellulomonas gelida]GGL23846.1 ABC transporter ATP-binding protein [Cellulomonas gelida]